VQSDEYHHDADQNDSDDDDKQTEADDRVVDDKPKEGRQAEVGRLVEVGHEEIGESQHANKGQAHRYIVFAPRCEWVLPKRPYGDLGSENQLGVGDEKHSWRQSQQKSTS
jgi:hypothetical protein